MNVGSSAGLAEEETWGGGGRAAPWTGFSIRKTGFLKLRFSEGFFRYTVLETHFLVIM